MKVIVILLIAIGINYGQGINKVIGDAGLDYTIGSGITTTATTSVWTPSFTGLSTAPTVGMPTPYSGSWLYFNGQATVRCLATPPFQSFLFLNNATCDSFYIADTMYFSGNARYLFGSGSWMNQIGMSAGTHIRQFYLGGGYDTYDTAGTMAVIDTSWNFDEFKYTKANTTLKIWVNGQLRVNNTSKSSGNVLWTDRGFAIGAWGGLTCVSDTNCTTTGNLFKGGLKYFRITKWTGTTDSTMILKMTGWGHEILVELWVDGVLKFSRLDMDRSNRGTLPYSLHLYNGMSEVENRRQARWVNPVGTVPTFIQPLGTGLADWDSTANDFLNRETFTNAEAIIYIADTPFVAVGGKIDNANGSMDVTGISTPQIAKYNLITNQWSRFTGCIPSSSVYTMYQKDSNLYLGGGFTSVSGVARTNRIAKYNLYTQVVSEVDSGFNNDVGFITSIDDTLYAGGAMTLSGATSIVKCGKLVNGVWTGFGSGFSSNVNAIVKYHGAIYFAGDFATANGVTCNLFAKYNWSTFVPLSVGGSVGLRGTTNTGSVYSMIVYNDSIRLGGTFDSAGGVSVSNYAVFGGTTFTRNGSMTWGSNTSIAAVIDQYIDSVHNVLGIVYQGSKWNDSLAYGMVMYNGQRYIVCPPNSLRPEGVRVYSGLVAPFALPQSRWIVMGDMIDAYGRLYTCNAIYELIPIWSR